MKLPSRRIAPVTLSALALAFSFSACAQLPPPSTQAALTTDKDKVSYAIGMQIGTNIANSLQPVKGDVDTSVVLRAIAATVNGDKPQMTTAEAQATMLAFGKKMQEKQQATLATLAQKNLTDGTAFLAANAKKPGIVTTASGLQYRVIAPGAGPKPTPSDTVKVNYTGQLLDGTTFDASAQHGGPATFQVGGVVPGWTEGLQLMSVGSKYEFWIPAKLAYGDQGTPGGPIGPNATLKFEVELVSIGGK